LRISTDDESRVPNEQRAHFVIPANAGIQNGTSVVRDRRRGE